MVGTISYFWDLETKNLIDLRSKSFIVNNDSISLLNNIINKSYIYRSGNIKRIILKKITLYY